MPANRLSRNALLAVVPWLVPTVITVFAIPITVRGLGDDAYGVMALVGAVAGYLALMQLGIGKGVVRYISMFIAAGSGRAARECLRTVVAWSSSVGLVGALTMWFLAPWLVTDLLKVPVAMTSETIAAFRIGGLTFLLGASMAPLSLVPSAFLRYDLVATLQTSLTSVGLAGPAIIVTLGYGLLPVMWFGALLNLLALIVYSTVAGYLLRGVPADQGPRFREHRRDFFAFVVTEGTNRVWCLIQAQTNKLVVGVVGGTSSAAYYQVSYTMSDRTNDLLNNMAGVLLPTVSQLAAEGDHDRIVAVYRRSSRLLFSLNASISASVAVFSAPLLYYWISPTYAREGGAALALLVLAQMIAATSQAGGNVNLALGRPKVNLVFSVINSVVNLATVYFLTVAYGITGTAISFLLAAFVMPTFVHYTNRAILGIGSWPVFRDCYLRTILVCSAVGAVAWYFLRPLATSLLTALALLGVTIMASLLACSVVGVITREDRASIRGALRREKSAPHSPPLTGGGDGCAK